MSEYNNSEKGGDDGSRKEEVVPQESTTTTTTTTTIPEELNTATAGPKAKDFEGIGLLRQIFPELPLVELHRLHSNRVRKSVERNRQTASLTNAQQPSSALGQRIWNQLHWFEENSPTAASDEAPMVWRPMDLPDDFLRLPPTVAVRRFNDKNGKWYYLLINKLEQHVLEQHQAHEDFSGAAKKLTAGQEYYTRAVHRDVQCGLGMTLCEEGGRIWVHSLYGRDGNRWFVAPPEGISTGGPTMAAGVAPGDWLLGINGQALVPWPSGQRSVLQDAVSTIQYSEDPIVLHLRRVPTDHLHPLVTKHGALQSVIVQGASLLDTTTLSTETLSDDDSLTVASKKETAPSLPRVHPLVKSLVAKGLIKGVKAQDICTKRLAQFTERARQWESFASFRLDARSYNLSSHFDPKDLPPDLCAESLPFEGVDVESFRPYTPSTPTLDPSIDHIPPEYLNAMEDYSQSTDGDDCFLAESNNLLSGKPVDLETRRPNDRNRTPNRKMFPGRRKPQRGTRVAASDICIPLMGIRKALCIRIVNTFLENNRTAYTIWAFDVEAGREWYAPVRYLRDFQDLRSAVIPLCPSMNQLSFPQQAWNVFGREKAESEEIRESKCRQLERFLRQLSTILYTEKLHPVISEIAIHLQSFLGCDGGDAKLQLHSQITLNEAMVWQMPEPSHSKIQMSVRLLLKRSIQRYVFRLFLLDQLQKVVDDFVNATRERGPSLRQIELIESQGRNKLKERAMEDLERIQAFLDQMQTVIIDGCREDLLSISRRRDFMALRPFMDSSQGDAYLDRVFRESVREQIEIEIYVPLRGVVSRLLVNGWRHDDMELHFKMSELKRRPQSAFRIPSDKESPSSWSSASSILNEGVGMSTLPCAKLRAIVDSAKEITRIYTEETKLRPKVGDESNDELGADDFLPIFIYCVVQAEMERPCALCVLLRTLCEPTNRIGEIGYYLASFEAAITHIQEINLAES